MGVASATARALRSRSTTVLACVRETVTWFYDPGPQTCQFHGVMQYSHT